MKIGGTSIPKLEMPRISGQIGGTFVIIPFIRITKAMVDISFLWVHLHINWSKWVYKLKPIPPVVYLQETKLTLAAPRKTLNIKRTKSYGAVLEFDGLKEIHYFLNDGKYDGNDIECSCKKKKE